MALGRPWSRGLDSSGSWVPGAGGWGGSDTRAAAEGRRRVLGAVARADGSGATALAVVRACCCSSGGSRGTARSAATWGERAAVKSNDGPVITPGAPSSHGDGVRQGRLAPPSASASLSSRFLPLFWLADKGGAVFSTRASRSSPGSGSTGARNPAGNPISGPDVSHRSMSSSLCRSLAVLA